MTLPTTAPYIAAIIILAAAWMAAPSRAEPPQGRPDAQRVYVICQIVNGTPMAPCKIGISNNPERRLRTFQTSSPLKLAIYETFRVRKARRVEKAAHGMLAKYRTNARNEWFDVSPEDAARAVRMVSGQTRPGVRARIARWWLRLRVRGVAGE